MSRPISSESAFRAIAHPTRRRLLELTARREWSACDLASQFNHTQPTLSKHLRILDSAGLVLRERRGRNFFYRISPAWIESVSGWLGRLATTTKQTGTASSGRGASSDGASPKSARFRDLWPGGA